MRICHVQLQRIRLVHHRRCAAVVSRGWANLSACCFPICLSCAILCQMVPFQYSSSSSLHRLADLPLGVFLSQGFQVVIRSVHRLFRILLTCPVLIHFRLLVCSVTSKTIVFSLTQVFVFLSGNILPSIFVCAVTSLFFV